MKDFKIKREIGINVKYLRHKGEKKPTDCRDNYEG